MHADTMQELMQRFRGIASTYARYLHGICMAAWCICMVFAWGCMHMQVPCKSEKPPLTAAKNIAALRATSNPGASAQDRVQTAEREV